MKKQKELSVVFLMWIPYGIDHLLSFIDSYLLFPAGVEHDLIIIFNGYQDEENLVDYHQLLVSRNVRYSFLTLEKGQDIFAYRWTAQQLSSTYVLFFNTYSQLLNKNWGLYYLQAISNEDVGCVAATGSWQSKSGYGFNRIKWIFSKKEDIVENLPFYEKKKVVLPFFSFYLPQRLALLAAFFKSLTNIFHFPFFPNPHLRTNAFIVNRVFWLNLEFNSLKKKKDAYLMESGRNSFTRQILRKQKKVLVINKYGDLFEPEDWITSKTLWYSNQENLLVNDNFTMLYSTQSKTTRHIMTKFLWRISDRTN
jgi:hypothetical protein